MQEINYIYSGIPTFMGGDFIKKDDINKYDVIFLGVPSDYGVCFRAGAKNAPRIFREYSSLRRINGMNTYDLDNECNLVSNNLKIADIGDVDVAPADPELHQKNIALKTKAIRKHSFPFVCGGDHSITYGSFVGCYKAIKEQNKDLEIGIIHFDAHLDLEDKLLTLPRVWHGNAFRKLIQDGYLKGENLYTIGPRGIIDNNQIFFAKKNNINLFTANSVKKFGIDKIINLIIEKNSKKNIKFYITFDIDCLDISLVHGTGTPRANGLLISDIEKAFQLLSNLDIIGFDLVELNPEIDPSKSSFVLAIELVYHYLAFAFKQEKI